MRIARTWAIFLAAVILLPFAARADGDSDTDDDEQPTNALALGFKGNWDTEASGRSFDWGPTLNLDLFSSPKRALYRWKYGLEYGYDDESSRLANDGSHDQSRVRTSELKYAKISFLRVRGFDFKESLHLVPYVSGGVQYVDSREDGSDGRTNRFFWAPTWGFGFDFDLNKKLTLGFDFDRNTEGGARRIARMSVEAKVYVFGNSDD